MAVSPDRSFTRFRSVFLVFVFRVFMCHENRTTVVRCRSPFCVDIYRVKVDAAGGAVLGNCRQGTHSSTLPRSRLPVVVVYSGPRTWPVALMTSSSGGTATNGPRSFTMGMVYINRRRMVRTYPTGSRTSPEGVTPGRDS